MSRLVTAAEHLLRLADELEKEAAEKTLFSCGGCGHVASMSEINSEIKKFASKEASEGRKVVLSSLLVEVNDVVKCASCGEGFMSYASTPDSEPYYVDVDHEEKEASEEVDLMEDKEAASEPESYTTKETEEKPLVGVNKEKLAAYLSI